MSKILIVEDEELLRKLISRIGSLRLEHRQLRKKIIGRESVIY